MKATELAPGTSMYPIPNHGTVANVVPAADFQNLQAQLEDMQQSLAAALARIEVFRMREKLLVAEVAKLRLANQSVCNTVDAAATEQVSIAAAGQLERTTTGQQQHSGSGAQQQPVPQQQQEQPEHVEQQPGQQQQAQLPLPVYITEVEDHLPVMLIGSGGRKTPGSIVVNKDYVDFVEVRARVKRHEFVGFTSAPAVPGHARRAQTSSAFSATWKQFLPSCLSPEPSSPKRHGSKVAAADSLTISMPTAADGSSTGDSSAVQPAVGDTAHASSAGGGISSSGFGSPGAATAAAAASSPRAAWYPEQEHMQHQQQQHHELLGVGPWVGSGSDDGSPRHGTTGVWQILWRGGGMQQRLAFEATQETRRLLHNHTAKWLNGSGNYAEDQEVVAAVNAANAAGAAGEPAMELAVPRHLLPGSYTPRMSDPSTILSSSSSSSSYSNSVSSSNSSGLVDGVRHIAAALPARYQTRDWVLLYGTSRHGISLQTLYRKAAAQPATVLIVKDAGGYVFGAFCSEPWRPSPRFFGTGETFVFQLEPHKVMFPWQVKSPMKNDFFMYAQPEALAVGGLGAFAIWLDAELLQGSSGTCGTFGSPCLASKEEFKITAVELWGLQ